MKASTQKLLGDIVGDLVELSTKVRAIEDVLKVRLHYVPPATLETPVATVADSPVTYTLPDAPVAERKVTDRYDQTWVATGKGEARPLPNGLRGELVMPLFDPVGGDPWTPTLTWPMLLAERGPLQLVPLTEAELADEVLYGPRGARWGNPNQPCPYVGTMHLLAGGWTDVACGLGVGHTGPHADQEGGELGMTAPSGRTTDGAVTSVDLVTVCTCGRPDQHQPGCPRYARTAGLDHDAVMAAAAARIAANEAYVCPQCGPDPAGPVVHTETRHVWPPVDVYGDDE